MEHNLKIAFLGPEGTNSDVALNEFLPLSEKVPCFSIAEIFEKVCNKEVEAGLVPIENLLQGSITVTLDLLSEYKERVFINDSFIVEIKHSLGILNSEDIEKVKTLHSIPAAISQCIKYVQNNFKNIQIIPSSSTAEAAKSVYENQDKEALVIANKLTLEKYKYHILAEDISDKDVNKTRFLLISREKNLEGCECVEKVKKNISSRAVTSIIIEPGMDRQGLLYDLLNIITVKSNINLLSIHSRPDTKGGFIFYMDLEGEEKEEKVTQCMEGFRDYFARHTSGKTKLTVLGTYELCDFFQPAIKNVLVIGGKGNMGKWLYEFFSQAGLNVSAYDKDSKEKLEDLIKEDQAIILSVPMTSIKEVAGKISSLIRKDTLIIENCSIKSHIHRDLLSILPQDTEILSLHTLFGSDCVSVKDQNVIFIDYDNKTKKSEYIEELFYKQGARIFHTTVEKHDSMSAFMQSLLHFTLIGLAETLKTKNFCLEDINAFSTTNSRRVLKALERVLTQNESLLLDMQTLNSQSSEIRKDFIENIKNLDDLLTEQHYREFSDLVKSNKLFFEDFFKNIEL